MKKVLSLIAALSLTLSMSATVFAADNDPIEDVNTGNTKDISITAQYTKGENIVPNVYNVTVSWEQTGTLTYTVGSDTYNWNTTSLAYDKVDGKGKWECADAKVNITVTNRSNAAVKASVSVTSSLALTDEKPADVVVPTAAKGLKETGVEQSKEMVYKITDVSGAIDQNTTIATLTVKIEAAN